MHIYNYIIADWLTVDGNNENCGLVRAKVEDKVECDRAVEELLKSEAESDDIDYMHQLVTASTQEINDAGKECT